MTWQSFCCMLVHSAEPALASLMRLLRSPSIDDIITGSAICKHISELTSLPLTSSTFLRFRPRRDLSWISAMTASTSSIGSIVGWGGFGDGVWPSEKVFYRAVWVGAVYKLLYGCRETVVRSIALASPTSFCTNASPPRSSQLTEESNKSRVAVRGVLSFITALVFHSL